MNKKIIIFTLIFMLFSVSFVSASYCDANDVLNVLRKALYLYYTNPSESPFTAAELKILLRFYMGIQSGQITVECSEQSSMIDIGNALPDNIPTCSDGTKYGKCNLDNKPMYCYAGNLVPRCRLCGCPTDQWCDITYVYTEKGNKGQWGKCYPGDNTTCSVNTDCGLSSYIGDYLCITGDVYRNYTKHTCLNPGETNSSCKNETIPVLIDDCNVTEQCVEGQPECQTVVIPPANLTCLDGTSYGQCSTTKPKYCDNGTLIDNCQVCGCDTVGCGGIAIECEGNGSCQKMEFLIPGEKALGGIDYDGSNIWLGEHEPGGAIYKINPENGEILETYPAPSPGGDNSVVGLAYDTSRDKLYHLFFPSGKVLSMDVPTWTQVPDSLFSTNSYSHDITFDGEFLWVTRYTGRVYKYSQSGANLGSFIANLYSGAHSITWDGSNLWMMESDGEESFLYKIDQDQAFADGSIDGYVLLQTGDVGRVGRITWEDPHYIWAETQSPRIIKKLDLSNCEQIQTCSDGTLYGQCSTTKPKYCDNGGLIDKCQTCGCDTGTCQTDGSCSSNVTSDLIMYLSFDDEIFGVANDVSGNNNSGILYGPPSVTTGKVGNALHFDGNDYVIVADSPSLDLINQITVSAWVKMDAGSSSGKIFQKQWNSGGYFLGAWFANPDGYAFEIWDADRNQHLIYTGVDPVRGEWQHVAATFDDLYMSIYQNGILLDTIPYAGKIGTNDEALYIGIQQNMLMGLKGSIDELKIYSRGLTPQEICEEAGQTWSGSTCASKTNQTFEIVQITTNTAVQQSPIIYGDKIVWHDNRNGNWDIYMYDLSNGQETPVITNTAGQGKPDIYGNKIVWHDERNGNLDIYTYDLSNNQERRIAYDTVNQYYPKIYGDKIVWHNDNYEIYIYDLYTSNKTPIVTSYPGGGDPDIYGNKIVWNYYRNRGTTNDFDIHMYDLFTGQDTPITTIETSQQGSPAIYGNKIVWQDNRNGNWDIYMYDISTGQETQITTDSGNQNQPAIYGDKIVWHDDRNGNLDIYMYDISTGQETQITTDSTAQQSPAIYGTKIVWADTRNGNLDIYMTTIS